MNNVFEVQKIDVSKGKITVFYKVAGEWSYLFTGEPFEAESL